MRIKTLFNLALNRVGEFAARALKIACDLAVDLLHPAIATHPRRRSDRITLFAAVHESAFGKKPT